MVVESKYNVGDTVWCISSNKVKQEKVSGVFIEVDDDVFILYNVVGCDEKILENKLFGSKEELLKSL